VRVTSSSTVNVVSLVSPPSEEAPIEIDEPVSVPSVRMILDRLCCGICGISVGNKFWYATLLSIFLSP
jgi:hypothetical protein